MLGIFLKSSGNLFSDLIVIESLLAHIMDALTDLTGLSGRGVNNLS